MDESLSPWLALREAADHAARSDALTRGVADALGSQHVSVLDLATGTGSNLRFLAPRLPSRQRWLLVDRDPALLSEVHARAARWAAGLGWSAGAGRDSSWIRGRAVDCHVQTHQTDLCRLDDRKLFEGRGLVTASALLDLVSDEWLRALAARCRAARAAALFTITYNGRSSCTPAEPEDDTIRELLNRHQKRDKGLGGPAAGPDAISYAERAFRDAGYVVRRAPSDWHIGPGDREFQARLIEGWAGAALEMAPHLGPTITGWKERRLAHVARGRSHVVVGHDDLAAWLPRH